MKKGSALIISLILVSVVGTAAFGFGRIIGIGLPTLAAHESGAIAYYAAESGLEEALLRLRLNNETIIPTNLTLQAGDKKVKRSNLTDSASQGIVVNLATYDTPVDYQDKQYYDLRINSTVSRYGEDLNNSGTITDDDLKDKNYGVVSSSPYRIIRDEAKKFKVSFADNDDDVSFSFKPVDQSSGDTVQGSGQNNRLIGDKNCVLIEAKLTGKDVFGKLSEEKRMLYNGSGCTATRYTTIGLLDNDKFTYPYTLVAGNIVSDLRLKSIIWPSLIDQDAELSLKPIGTDIVFLMSSIGGATSLLGPTTHIESIGYYGGVRRKLVADIDRQNGTVYDLFDYVLYKGE